MPKSVKTIIESCVFFGTQDINLVNALMGSWELYHPIAKHGRPYILLMISVCVGGFSGYWRALLFVGKHWWLNEHYGLYKSKVFFELVFKSLLSCFFVYNNVFRISRSSNA